MAVDIRNPNKGPRFLNQVPKLNPKAPIHCSRAGSGFRGMAAKRMLAEEHASRYHCFFSAYYCAQSAR